MRDAGIGRVLVAALHQGIADELPDRLEFYENWLNAEGLRNGTIGLAPLAAVLGFLRTEGDAYDSVTRRAGEYAADWTSARSSSTAWPSSIASWRCFGDLLGTSCSSAFVALALRRARWSTT